MKAPPPLWTATSSRTRTSSTTSSPRRTRFRAVLGSSRPPGPLPQQQDAFGPGQRRSSIGSDDVHPAITTPVAQDYLSPPASPHHSRRPRPGLRRRILTCPPLPRHSRRSRHPMTEHPEPDNSKSTAPPASGAGVHGSAGSAPNSSHGGHRRQSTEPAGPDHLSQCGKTAGELLDEIVAQRRTLLDRLASG